MATPATDTGTEVCALRSGNLSRSAPTIRAEFGQKVRGGGVKKVGVLGTLGVPRVGCNATQRARVAAMCSTRPDTWSGLQELGAGLSDAPARAPAGALARRADQLHSLI